MYFEIDDVLESVWDDSFIEMLAPFLTQEKLHPKDKCVRTEIHDIFRELQKTFGQFVLNRDSLLPGGMFMCCIFISVVVNKIKCFCQRLLWENLVNHDEPYKQENKVILYMKTKKYLPSFYYLKKFLQLKLMNVNTLPQILSDWRIQRCILRCLLA